MNILDDLLGDAQPATDVPPSEDARPLTRKELADIIEASNDFDELTGPIARQVAESGLPESTILSLRKFIAKKAKVSVASLVADAEGFNTVFADRDENHLFAAQETVTSLGGPENLIYANGSLWGWRGGGVWRVMDDREVKKAIHKVVEGQEMTKSVVDSILDLVKTEVYRPNHQFEQGDEFVNCLNGEIHFVDGEWVLRPHNRENYRLTQIPVPYDPNATAPRFGTFLDEIFQGDDDAVEKTILLLEMMGYTLMATCRFEKFIILIGKGANGKSVILAVLEAIVGRGNIAAVQPDQLDNRFQRGHLYGKLANIVTELPVGGEIADAQLKSITSGEVTTAEHKFKDPFDFHPVTTFWFGTNHMPHTRDTSDAIFRRAIVLSFNRKFEGENCDPLLKEKLLAELPGILNLALEAIAGVLLRKSFTVSESCEMQKAKWRNDADQAGQFVEEVCELIPSERTPSVHIWNA